MTYPEDLVLENDVDAAVREGDAPEADAAEQARPVRHDESPDERVSPGPEVDEAGAAEQARAAHLPDDDYR